MRLVGAGVYDVSEYHAIWVPGSAARALAALREVTAAEVPLVRLLTGIRALPGRLAGKHRRPLPRDEPLFDQLLSGGFVVLAEDPGAEVVLGTIGQFWDLAGGISPKIDDATGFRDFDDPGFAKAAINFPLSGPGPPDLGRDRHAGACHRSGIPEEASSLLARHPARQWTDPAEHLEGRQAASEAFGVA